MNTGSQVRVLLMCALVGGSGVCDAVAEQAGGKPHILLIHDMEGLAGQDDPYSFVFGHPKYGETRKQLTADVNAVVAGLFAGGAGAVTIADGHGSGSAEPDVLVEQLDRRAKLISRPEYFDTYLDLAEPGAFDAVAVVGMHSKSGTNGFAAHTYTVGAQIFFNGHSVTETELVGMLYGAVGIPVIFASGDDRLAEDLRTMPWLRYVVTKKAKSVSTVELLPVAEVHAAMQREAKIAVEMRASAQVMKPQRSPIDVAVRAVPPAGFRWLRDMPGIYFKDDTVWFTAANVAAAYAGIRPFVNAMHPAFNSIERSVVSKHPDGKQLKYDGRIELFRRWLEAESAGAPPAPADSEEVGEYHGFY